MGTGDPANEGELFSCLLAYESSNQSLFLSGLTVKKLLAGDLRIAV